MPSLAENNGSLGYNNPIDQHFFLGGNLGYYTFASFIFPKEVEGIGYPR